MRNYQLTIRSRSSLLLLPLALAACSDSGSTGPGGVEGPVLEFTEPPFALQGIDARFAADIPYGPYPDNTFDIFLPASPTPTALVIYIHGGGFIGGSKEAPYAPMWNGSWDFPQEIRTLLAHGVAFATIDYRLLSLENETEGILKSLGDSKRALQYVRSIHETLNIDKSAVVLAGSSAGGGTSEWLAFSDDMADPSSADPVLRESTRVRAIAVKATQASYDLERYETDVFIDYDFHWADYLEADPSMVDRFLSFYAMDSLPEFDSPRVEAYRAEVDMLAMMSPDDPEFWVANLQTPVVEPTRGPILNHHSFHARTLKSWGDSIGIPNVVYYGTHEDPGGEDFVSFILRKLGRL